MSSCQKVRPGATTYAGRQGFDYAERFSRESVEAQAFCMHLLAIPPGGRAKAHKHAMHETAICVLASAAVMAWGDRLEHRMEIAAGEMVHIPADVPHLPWNPGAEPATGVVARTDPHEQENVVLLPDLDALVG